MEIKNSIIYHFFIDWIYVQFYLNEKKKKILNLYIGNLDFS